MNETENISDGELDTAPGPGDTTIKLFTPDQLAHGVADIAVDLDSSVSSWKDEDPKTALFARIDLLLNLEYVMKHVQKYDEAKKTQHAKKEVCTMIWRQEIVRDMLDFLLAMCSHGKRGAKYTDRLLNLLEIATTAPLRNVEEFVLNFKVVPALLLLCARTFPEKQAKVLSVLDRTISGHDRLCIEASHDTLIPQLLSRGTMDVVEKILKVVHTCLLSLSTGAKAQLIAINEFELLFDVIDLVKLEESPRIVKLALCVLTEIAKDGSEEAIKGLRAAASEGRLSQYTRGLSRTVTDEQIKKAEEISLLDRSIGVLAIDFLEVAGKYIERIPPTKNAAATRIQSLWRGKKERKRMGKEIQRSLAAKRAFDNKHQDLLDAKLNALLRKTADSRAVSKARNKRVERHARTLRILGNLPTTKAVQYIEKLRHINAITIQQWWKRVLVVLQKRKEMPPSEEPGFDEDSAAQKIQQAFKAKRYRQFLGNLKKQTYMGKVALLRADGETEEAKMHRMNETTKRILDNVALYILNQDLARESESGKDKESREEGNEEELSHDDRVLQAYSQTLAKLKSKSRLTPLSTAAAVQRKRTLEETASLCRQLDECLTLDDMEKKMASNRVPKGPRDVHAREWISDAMETSRITNPTIVYDTGRRIREYQAMKKVEKEAKPDMDSGIDM